MFTGNTGDLCYKNFIEHNIFNSVQFKQTELFLEWASFKSLCNGKCIIEIKFGTTKLLIIVDEMKCETTGWSVDSDSSLMHSSKTVRITIKNIANFMAVDVPFGIFDHTKIYVKIVKKNILQFSKKISSFWISFPPERETWTIELSFSAQPLRMTSLFSKQSNTKCE